MRYTIAYITAGIIASIGGVILLVALVPDLGVVAEPDKQSVLLHVVIAGSLFAAAVQFVVLGHLLTEIRDLRRES